MKKTNISALLLAALLLIQLLCAPVSAVTAEPAADAQTDAQTASDNSAGDAAAEADSVPEDQLLSSREQFSVAAKAALLIDLNTNRVVYEQDADERIYPASLTKIMTCLIALENGNLSDVVTVSESALADLDEDSSVAGLVVGEQMTLENLLYCMMVVSGNDACNVIAEHVAGSVTDFVRMMNQRAYELGCTQHAFQQSPRSARREPLHHRAGSLPSSHRPRSRARISATIVEHVWNISCPATNLRQTIPQPQDDEYAHLPVQMSNSLLLPPGASASRPAIRRQAGRCVISEATGDGLDLLGIVCGAATTVLDSGDHPDGELSRSVSRLFDYGFDNFSYLSVLSPLYPVGAGDGAATPPAPRPWPSSPEDDIKVLLPNGLRPESQLDVNIELDERERRRAGPGGAMCSAHATVSYDGRAARQRPRLLAIADVAAFGDFLRRRPTRRPICSGTGGSGSC